MKIQTRYSYRNGRWDETSPTIRYDASANPVVLSFSYDADDLIDALLEDPERPPAETLGLREEGWKLYDTDSATDEGRHTQVVFARPLTAEERARWRGGMEAKEARQKSKATEIRAELARVRSSGAPDFLQKLGEEALVEQLRRAGLSLKDVGDQDDEALLTWVNPKA